MFNPRQLLQSWAARIQIRPQILSSFDVGTLLYTAGIRGEMTYTLLDGQYWALTVPDLERVLKHDWTHRWKWLKSRRDCDDFAVYFKARMSEWFGVTAVGIVIDNSSNHVYNVIITANPGGAPGILYFEPQTGEFVVPRRDLYLLERGQILI
jgi:hypothetical protein